MKPRFQSMGRLVGLCMLSTTAALAATGPAVVNGARAVVPAATAPALRPSSLSAEQIVAKNVVARGGLEGWRAVQTMTMSGKLDAGPEKPNDLDYRPATSSLAKAENRAVARSLLEQQRREGAKPLTMIQLPFVMEQKRGHKQRVEIAFQGQTAVQVYDGEHGWKVRPFLARKEAQPYSAEEARLAAQQQELDGALIDYKAKGTNIAVEGIEPVEGHDAYNLRLTLKGGAVRHVWVDAQSFLEVKIDGSRRLDGKQVPVATYLRDYRAVNGLMMPYLTETQVSGVKYSEKVRIETVALNTKLDDSRFFRPL